VSDYQPFGYTGEPGTCFWCGRRLRRRKVSAEPGEPGATKAGLHFWTKPAARLGGYQDDTFCGLRCGYQFGLRMAELGRRLQR
jgi:hypothetical protein